MNNLPKVVAQQRRGRASNPRLLDRKSDALSLSHRATLPPICMLPPRLVVEMTVSPLGLAFVFRPKGRGELKLSFLHYSGNFQGRRVIVYCELCS